MKTLPNKIALDLDGDTEVSVKGFIAPIENTLSNFHVEWPALANLRVAEPEKQHPTSVFQSFLPTKSVSVGECWQIKETGVLKLLRQLNPNPNLDMHIDSGDSRGLWACLRACNDRFADIVFRIHAEFKLEGGWFTPSQFTGNLIVNRIEGSVSFFEMYVPEGTVNFDLNWDSADAGFCSQMELHAGTREVVQDTEFTETITQEEVERALILCLYKSQKINWMPPDQVLEMAQARQKPIHAISIDGPLADESC
jgi:hypothetical protein